MTDFGRTTCLSLILTKLLIVVCLDVIRGVERDEPTGDENLKALQRRPNRSMIQDAAPKVVVTSDHEFVVVGVNARDRPGLLLDLSKGLLRLKLSLRHTEASVVGQRSISIWRCELVEAELPDLEEIWSILTALLENEHGIQAVKQGGLRVLRAVIPKTSTLIGKPASTVDFRKTYKAAIVAVQKGGRNVALSSVVFGSGDVLVLQISEDSALLKPPPADFYNLKTREGGAGNTSLSRSSSVGSFVKRITRTLSFENAQKALGLQSPTQTPIGDKPEVKPTTAADLETGKLQPDTHTNDQAAGSGSPLGADSDDEGFFFGVESSDDLGDIGYGGNEVMITNIVS